MNKHNTTNQVVETRDRQISKGIVVAMSCEILKVNEETYRVQSEKAVDRYYIVRFSNKEPNYCTCKNWEIQSQRDSNHVCKHMHSIIYASVNGLIVENNGPAGSETQPNQHTTTTRVKSYSQDDYSF